MEKPKTIRRELVPDEQVLELLQKLEEMPGRIQKAKDSETDAQLEVTNAAMALQEAQNRVEEMKAETLFVVQMETVTETKDGKEKVSKKYGNESQRGAAATKLLNADPAYREAADALIQTRQNKTMAEFRQGKTHNASGFAYNERATALAAAVMVSGLSHESATNSELERLFLWDSEITRREEKIEKVNQYLQEACNGSKSRSTSEAQ